MGIESGIATILPVCPYCNTKGAAFYLVDEHTCKLDSGAPGHYVSFWICGCCEGGVVGESDHQASNLTVSKIFNINNFYKLLPKPKELKAAPYTPQKIADTYVTALKILNCSTKDLLTEADAEACCMTIRKAVELAVNEQNATGKNLYQKIEDLANRNILTDSMRMWAQEIRSIGNDGAHEDGAVSLRDAEQATFFADMLFRYLYTLPGMIAERRQARK